MPRSLQSLKGKTLLQERPRESWTFHQTTSADPWRAAIYSRSGATYKYLHRGDFVQENAEEELYELNSDPAEKVNLISSAPAEVIEKCRHKLREHFIL